MIEWAVTSSVLILVVLVLRRLLMGRISLRLQYGLWALVLLRLLVPVSFGTTAVSILNLVENTAISNPVVGYVGGHTIQLSISEPDPTLPLEEQQKQYEENLEHWQAAMDADRAENGTPIPLGTVLLGVWAAGAVGVGLWLSWVNVCFARKLRRSRKPLETDGPLPVYVAGAAQTPCLFGLFYPCVYVTEEAAANETILRHSLVHELTHYRHKDHIWAAMRGLCLALHWYNPLVWLAAALSRRDEELCCDEATVRSLGEEERAAYGRTLLAVTCQGRVNPLLIATSMTGSGNGIKERIVLLAKRPKTALYTLTAVILIAAIAVGCTFTGAEKEDGVTVTLAEGIEAPQAVSDYAREYVEEQLSFYTEKEGYEITKAEIVGLTAISTGSAAENSGVSMYLLEYRLKAAHPEEVVLAGGMTMEDGAITEWGSAGQPYLLLGWADSGEETTWEPLQTTHTLPIEENYGTPEMLEEYGDAYTAAAVELYRSWQNAKKGPEPFSADMLSQGVYDALAREWDAYNQLSKEARLLSSHIPGSCDADFDDWASCEKFLGLSIPNPLEDSSWLEKGTYVGMPEGFRDAPRVRASWYGSWNGHVEWISVQSGYQSGDLRITLDAMLYGDSPIGKPTDSGWSVELARQSYLADQTGDAPLIVKDEGEQYVSLTAYLAQGHALYRLDVIGTPDVQGELQETMERALDCFF